MKIWNLILMLILAASVLAGCGGQDASSAEEQDTSNLNPESSIEETGYTSEALVASYEGALSASSQLALGTVKLEETGNAVTSGQAKTLLPLWQALQSDALQSDAETNAVLKQIEGALTAEQLAAIAAMQLTTEGMGAWMREQGMNFGRPPGMEGGQNPLGNMSEEERESMRATAQAGGGLGGGGRGLGNMSQEERESMRATAEASGMTFPEGGGPGAGARAGGRGQLALLAQPLVELLTERAGE